MIRRPPRSTRTDTLFPYTTLFRSITAMQTPSLVASIARDLETGYSAVVQIVSTGEALMERRLADIPTDEWDDVRVDVTPREYVLSYLQHSFSVQLYEPFTDSER